MIRGAASGGSGALSRGRDRLRATRLGSWAIKLVVLVVGAALIALGLVLAVLPGPLTIPPVLLGLWVLSTEFHWAERLRLRAAAHGRVVWAATRRRPVHATLVTASGLLVLVAALVTAHRYDVMDRLLGQFG
jgi:hypothetical protein